LFEDAVAGAAIAVQSLGIFFGFHAHLHYRRLLLLQPFVEGLPDAFCERFSGFVPL
jgi:hypothetical protein